MEDWQAKLKRIFWGSGKGLREAPPEAQIAYKKYTSDIKNMPWWKVLFFNSPHSPSVSYAIKDSLMFNGGILCIGIAVLEIGFLVTVGPKEWTHFHHSLIMAPFTDNTNDDTQKNNNSLKTE